MHFLKPLVSRQRNKRLKNKASILIIALWSICLLTTFAVCLGSGVRQKLILVQRLNERGKLRFIAEAGVKRAIVEVQKEIENPFNTLNDGWANNEPEFKGIVVGDGTCNIYYNYIDEQSGLFETRFGLIDEERKLNINKVSRVILERLFQVALNFDEMQAQELSACIVDWRDPDSELSIPLGSAEDYDYRSQPNPYEAKDADFEVLEEVLLVKGMSEEILEQMRDYITIYGDGKVNANTASREIFLALGLDEYLVEKIILFRQGEDGILGTADDNTFESSGGIVSSLSQMYPLSPSEVVQLSAVASESLGTSSNFFLVKSIAKLNNRENTTELNSVVDKDGEILYWQEP